MAEAAEVMNQARILDLQDRFINSKSTKYYIRADQLTRANEVVALFSKVRMHVRARPARRGAPGPAQAPHRAAVRAARTTAIVAWCDCRASPVSPA